MGLLVDCPECKRRNSQKEKFCKKCGFSLARFSGRVWWIEYYDQEKRLRRERIGPNKVAAEIRLLEVKKTLVEGRYIQKNPEGRTTFRELATWYLELAAVKAKRSYLRDRQLVANLVSFFGNRLLKDINPSLIEAYRQERLQEPSARTGQTRGDLTAPATVNREIACLKTMFNRAKENGKAENNPAAKIKMLKENNERDRVLSEEEFHRLLAHCPPYLKPVVKMAYYTGMRQSEILNLTWGQVDLKEGFIKLTPNDTKTREGRLVPLNRELVEMLRTMPRGLPLSPVFTYQGRSMAEIKRSFTTACKRAGIEDFTFHDLRHTAINNWRLKGHDYFRIMAATGHKTLSVFKRYNTVSKEELKVLAGENRN
ncbi:MAG: tyrosine-type recombinase/integrase [Desulfobaccales bacterium]